MGKNHERNLLPLFLAKTKFPEVTGIVTAILPRSVKGKDKHVGTDSYSGPEGARVKVPPLFLVITRGRKAPESRFRLCFL